jgi:hypothetical protein
MTDIGDVVRFGNYSGAEGAEAFQDIDGIITDPIAVVLVVQRPDGSQLVYGWPTAGDDGPLTKEATGRFYADVEIDQSGKWRYRLEGDGIVTAAAEGTLRVDRQQVLVP